MEIKDNILHDYYQILETLEKSPGDEEAIDLLVNLEEDIKDYLIDTLKHKHGENHGKSNVYQKFKKGKKDRDYLESLVMKKTTGDKVSINDLTDSFINKINEVLSNKHDTKEKIKLLNIQTIHLDNVVLPPDYDKKPETGSGNGWIEKELNIDKFSLLIQYLRERGIYTDDVLIIDGLVRENMMRKESYYCIYIPRINKTVFVNNGYGEATFIYDGILDIERFTQFGKQGLKPILKKIIFSQENIEKRKQEIYRSLFGSIEGKKEDLKPKIDIKELKSKITLQIIKEYFKNKPIEYWQNLQNKQRKLLKINGQGLVAVANFLGIDQDRKYNKNVNGNKDLRYDMLEKIYGKKIDREELTKEIIEEYFKNKPIEYWQNLQNKQRKLLKINGQGLVAVASFLGIQQDQNKNVNGNKDLRYDMLEKIYGEKIEREKKIEKEELTKEKIEEYFKKENLEYWKLLSSNDRKQLNICGYGLRKIATFLGVFQANKKDINGNKDLRYDMLEKIFGEKIETEKRIEKEELTKEKIEEYFKRENLEYWKGLKNIERQNIQINGQGLTAVASFLGIKQYKKKSVVGYKDLRYDMLEKIYGEKIEREKKIEKEELTKEKIKEYFKRENLEYWKGLNRKQRRDIKINGQGLTAVASFLGINQDRKHNKNVNKNKDLRYNMLQKIYGEKI